MIFDQIKHSAKLLIRYLSCNLIFGRGSKNIGLRTGRQGLNVPHHPIVTTKLNLERQDDSTFRSFQASLIILDAVEETLRLATAMVSANLLRAARIRISVPSIAVAFFPTYVRQYHGGQTPAQEYRCDVDAEPMHRYRPGGYHPVALGDSLSDGRYKVLHKLGWGSYSTTWAAKDQTYVCVTKMLFLTDYLPGMIAMLHSRSQLPKREEVEIPKYSKALLLHQEITRGRVT